MTIKIAVLISYFVAVLVIGFVARTRCRSTPVFLPVIWVMLITFGVYLIAHAYMQWRQNELNIYLPGWIHDCYAWVLLGIFILAMDFWAWDKIGPVFCRIPLWVGYFVVLSALQTVVMLHLVRLEH